jgi:predicted PhzF superfamily epimerase YddE/YHI9
MAGNPLAVFPGASDFDGTTMQKIAKELNLAETSLVLQATGKDCPDACAHRVSQHIARSHCEN